MLISSIPQTLKWKVYRGDTSQFSLAALDSDSNPLDLTGWSFLGQVRKTIDSDVLASLSIDSGVGVVTITLEADDALKLFPSNVFDLQATKPDGTVWTLIQGHLAVEGDISR
jgi:hypothetical protein